MRERKPNETAEIPKSKEMYAINLFLQRMMPSVRQSAKWGVRALKSSFGGFRLPLLADSYVQWRILELDYFLLNLRTRAIGLHQTKTTYADKYICNIAWAQRFVENLQTLALVKNKVYDCNELAFH